jgi:hypothetical protein
MEREKIAIAGNDQLRLPLMASSRNLSSVGSQQAALPSVIVTALAEVVRTFSAGRAQKPFPRSDRRVLAISSCDRWSGGGYNLFVLGINLRGDAQLDRAAECQHINPAGGREAAIMPRRLRWIENGSDHVPRCSRALRLSLRAVAISASISSMES